MNLLIEDILKQITECEQVLKENVEIHEYEEGYSGSDLETKNIKLIDNLKALRERLEDLIN